MGEDLATIIVNHPLFWVVLILVIVFFIIKEINKGKTKPEQKPDFGIKVRAERVGKHIKKRQEHLGTKIPMKTILYFGQRSLGIVTNIDNALVTDRSQKKEETVNIKIITYRRFGFLSTIISSIGFGKKRMLVDEETITFGEEKIKGKRYMALCIPENVVFRERGGILFVSKSAIATYIDQINTDADMENLKGYVSDQPRRVSNLHPIHASKADQLELESSLEDKTEERKRKFWGR